MTRYLPIIVFFYVSIGNINGFAMYKRLGKGFSSDSPIETLAKAYKKRPNSSILLKMNNIACRSDGELASEANLYCVDVFEAHPKNVLSFISINKATCMFEAITLGYSEELSVYKFEQRKKELEKLKKRLQLNNKLLTNKEKEVIKRLIKQIKPEMFD